MRLEGSDDLIVMSDQVGFDLTMQWIRQYRTIHIYEIGKPNEGGSIPN